MVNFLDIKFLLVVVSYVLLTMPRRSRSRSRSPRRGKFQIELFWNLAKNFHFKLAGITGCFVLL